MPAPTGHLQRALRDLTVGAVVASRARERQDREMAASELDLQFQVQVSGSADVTVTMTTVALDFETHFYYAPGNRDSDLEHPHLTSGGEADGAVAFSATVVAWHEDEDTGAITGADVMIGVQAPTRLDFVGKAHLNFQGWGVIADTAETEAEPN